MSQKNREPGFYWVRRAWDSSSDWEPAELIKDVGWLIVGCETVFYEDDSDFEIDEHRITREEQKS